jgi:hypothetical protein
MAFIGQEQKRKNSEKKRIKNRIISKNKGTEIEYRMLRDKFQHQEPFGKRKKNKPSIQETNLKI